MGTIGATWGLRGWVKVWSSTSPREGLLEYRQFNGVSPSWQGELSVCEAKQQGRFLAYKFNGFDTPEAAQRLNGVQLQISRLDLPEIEEGEYYWRDLIGLQVLTVGGVDLGQVVEMLETGSNDVMVVQGDRRRWLPFILPEVVTEIDMNARTCRVDWDPDF